MCDFIQISPESLQKQVSTQLPATPFSEGTASTTFSLKSQPRQFEIKGEDNLVDSQNQEYKKLNCYDKDVQTEMKDIIAHIQCISSQNENVNIFEQPHQSQKQLLLNQYQTLDKSQLMQILIEEKKKNQNLLKAYTRDTEKLKNEIFDLQKKLININEKQYKTLCKQQNSIHQKPLLSCNQTLFNSCNSEQIGFSSPNVGVHFQSAQDNINQLMHTFSNFNVKQVEKNTQNNINLIQSYTPITSNIINFNSSPSNFNKVQQNQNRSSNEIKYQKFIQNKQQQDISTSTQLQISPRQQLLLSNENINQNTHQTFNNINSLCKSTTGIEMSTQTIKLLKFLEDLIIKCSPTNLFKQNEKPTEKQIWRFIKTMTEEYVALKREEMQNCKLFTSLKDIFKTETAEKVIQLVKLQKEEVSILRKKIYIQSNQNQSQQQ